MSIGRRPFPFLGVSVLTSLLAGYAGLVTVAHWFLTVCGQDALQLETHLGLIGVAGYAAVRNGEAIWVAAVLLIVAGWRCYRRGFALDAWIVYIPAAILIVALSVWYARAAGETRSARHAEELADAVARGDRKHLREIAFACNVFCGFDRDSAPLARLVGEADSLADFNAMGLMVSRGAARNVRSGWLADRRTPLEIAVDRYEVNPALVLYLLGIGSADFHFRVARAGAADLDAALLYAIRRRASQALVRELMKHGAKEPAGAMNFDAAQAETPRALPPSRGF